MWSLRRQWAKYGNLVGQWIVEKCCTACAMSAKMTRLNLRVFCYAAPFCATAG